MVDVASVLFTTLSVVTSLIVSVEIGAVVSTKAESVPLVLVLPAASVTDAVTVNVFPSPGLGNVVVTSVAVMSAAVKV